MNEFLLKKEPFFRHTHYHTGFSGSESVNRNQGDKLSVMKMTVAGSRTFVITLRIIESKFPEPCRIAPCILKSCFITFFKRTRFQTLTTRSQQANRGGLSERRTKFNIVPSNDWKKNFLFRLCNIYKQLGAPSISADYPGFIYFFNH